MTDDDDLRRMMQHADPARTPADAGLDARAESTLHRITAPRPARTRRRRWAVAVALAVLAVLVAVAAQTVLPLTRPQQAAAATPPLLEITPTTETLAEVLAQAHERIAATSDADAQPARASTSNGWYLNADYGENGLESAVIAPQNTRLRWKADRSGRILVTAGRPYLADDPTRHEVPTDGGAPAEGTVLRDETFAAGEFAVAFPETPPADAAGLNAFILAGAAPDADASDYAGSVVELLNEWTITGAQHGVILDALAAYPGVELAGEAVDRTGRPGWVLRIHGAHQPNFDTLVIIDRATGRIAASETVYLGGLPDFDIPVPAVTTYVSWLEEAP